MELFNVKYVITGRQDGQWVVESFDSNDRPLGGRVYCRDSNHAWEVWAILNGQSHLIPTEQIQMNEDTQEIDISKAG